MPIPITIPRLGWNMEEGVFGGWLKQDGDAVRPGDALFTLETEKANEDVECLDGGMLRIPSEGPKVGDRLVVGTVIGYLVASANEALPPAGSAVVEPSPTLDTSVEVAEQREAVEYQRRERASSPRARRVAREMGIDLTRINGSGRDGRIRERDIRAAQPPKPVQGGRLAPITSVRRAIAARMVESLRQTAPVTLTTTVDATNLVGIRKRYSPDACDGPIPSYTELLVKLSAHALLGHPLLAGRWTDEGIVLPDAIHIGIAVDTDAGLFVPVVRDVPSLGIRQLAERLRELIERARQGRLSVTDTQGGCFTISNLGGYGIDAFTPIINYPECAVLGVGRIVRQPTMVGHTVVGRDVVTLSLTFDHRIVDGGPAARFLQTLSKAIENPDPILAT